MAQSLNRYLTVLQDLTDGRSKAAGRRKTIHMTGHATSQVPSHALTGDLKHLPLTNLFRIVRDSIATCCITFWRAGETIVACFQNGLLSQCRYRDMSDTDALSELCTWDNANFLLEFQTC